MRAKVLLIQEYIPHYRVPIFNELAKNVDLTVIFSEGEVSEDKKFNCMKIPTFRFYHKIHKKNIIKLAKQYDVVISLMDFSFFTNRLMSVLRLKKYKLAYWGIGVPAGYNQRYDSDDKIFKKSYKWVKNADALIFYCDYPINKYIKYGQKKEKLFVANNTVKIMPIEIDEEKKKDILFCGSLYRQKKIFELLDNYKNAYEINKNIANLLIIGDGEEKEKIKQWINENSLDNKIKLIGAIYDEDKLVYYFKNAIICISPDQAGLSVLKSMGYGVPFVTYKNAITGGEIFNIKDGENGVLLDSFDQLQDVILQCSENREKYINMGKKAQLFYNQNRKVEHMVEGFLKAINYLTVN